jgi:hypothetical protein
MPEAAKPAGNGLVLTCWLPAACLVGVELYVRGYDGWGAMASAPLFLLPFALSLAITGAGALRGFLEQRAGALRKSTLVCTGIAALPIAWLLVRRHFV